MLSNTTFSTLVTSDAMLWFHRWFRRVRRDFAANPVLLHRFHVAWCVRETSLEALQSFCMTGRLRVGLSASGTAVTRADSLSQQHQYMGLLENEIDPNSLTLLLVPATTSPSPSSLSTSSSRGLLRQVTPSPPRKHGHPYVARNQCFFPGAKM